MVQLLIFMFFVWSSLKAGLLSISSSGIKSRKIKQETIITAQDKQSLTSEWQLCHLNQPSQSQIVTLNFVFALSEQCKNF